jgi:hypothetical protein
MKVKTNLKAGLKVCTRNCDNATNHNQTVSTAAARR